MHNFLISWIWVHELAHEWAFWLGLFHFCLFDLLFWHGVLWRGAHRIIRVWIIINLLNRAGIVILKVAWILWHESAVWLLHHHPWTIAVKIDSIKTLISCIGWLLDQRELKLLKLIMLWSQKYILTHSSDIWIIEIHRFVKLWGLLIFPETIIPINLFGHLHSLDIFSPFVSLRRR